MVVDQINRGGGINGRKIQLVIADTESEPSKAVIALKRLIEKDKVVAVIGPTTTGAAMACMRTAEEARIPMVACVGGDAPVEPTEMGVQNPQRTSTAVGTLYGYLKAHKMTKVALLGASDKFGQEGEGVLKKLAPKYGIKIAAQESFDPTDADMTVQLIEGRPHEAAGDRRVDHRSRRRDHRKERQTGEDQHPAVPVPRPAGCQLPEACRRGRQRHDDARHQAGGRRPAPEERQAAGCRPCLRQGVQGPQAWADRHALRLRLGCDPDRLPRLKKAGTNPETLRNAIENTKGYVGVSGIYNMSSRRPLRPRTQLAGDGESREREVEADEVAS